MVLRCFVFFALVRLWSCGFGSVFLSCVLCSCKAMFSCLVSFVFVRRLKFSSCGLAVFFFLAFLRLLCFVLFWLKCSGYGLWACSFCLWLYCAVGIFRLWLLVLFCFLSYFFFLRLWLLVLLWLKFSGYGFGVLFFVFFCQAVVFGFLSG